MLTFSKLLPRIFQNIQKRFFRLLKRTMLSNLAKTYFVNKQMACSTNLVKSVCKAKS